MPLSPSDPDPILDVAVGYMAAKQLFAASRIGLFSALADGPLDATGLAARTGVPVTVTRILADSMAATGLLDRTGGVYALAPAARDYLAGPAATLDLSPYLRFLDEISYPHWQQFDHTVETGTAGDLALPGDRWDVFIGGVMTYNALHARMLAGQLDFGPYRRALDLGGLSSAFSIAAMQANQQLHTTFVVDPKMADAVGAQVAAAGLADRSTVLGEATETARPEGDADLVFVNHVIHRFDAAQNRAILESARGAAADRARLVLLDFFLDDDPAPRALDALHAGEYLVIDATVVYPEAEVREWCTAAGWRPVDRLTLPGSPRVLIAEAV